MHVPPRMNLEECSHLSGSEDFPCGINSFVSCGPHKTSNLRSWYNPWTRSTGSKNLMYVLIYDICFSLTDLLHSVWQTLGSYTSLQMTQFCACYGWVIFHCKYLPGGPVVKNPPAWCRRCSFNPWVRKIPWSRKWKPMPVLLPGKFHGQRSLEGYSPGGCKELDMTEWLSRPSIFHGKYGPYFLYPFSCWWTCHTASMFWLLQIVLRRTGVHVSLWIVSGTDIYMLPCGK